MKPKALTPKQQRFVDEYLVDLNATQASIRAGYSKKTATAIGSENLSKPNVAAAVALAQEQRAKDLGITEEYVLGTIRETVDRCRQEIEPVTDRRGEAILTRNRTGALVPAFAFDSRGVLKGCELLGRKLGIFKEKHEHTGKDGAPLIPELDKVAFAKRLAFLLTAGAHAKQE